jgi:hypothetical protein
MSLVKESSSFSGIYRLTKTTFYLKKKQQTACFKDILLFPTFLRFRCSQFRIGLFLLLKWAVFSTIFMATTKLSIIPENQSSSYIYVICVCLLIEVPNIYWLYEWHGGYLLESWDCLSFMDAWVHPRFLMLCFFLSSSCDLCFRFL